MSKNNYETVVGLEIHVQLSTRSKIFCADPVRFGAAPNTLVSMVSLAHPGTLPRLNRKVVDYAVRLGLALGSTINLHSRFDRKNYFYADLPKGYQITQDAVPICVGGQLSIDSPHAVSVRLHHIHLEEDAGKSLHDQDPEESLVDLNRAGVPLLEIVTEPDLRSAEEAAQFMEKMRRLVRWLGISDGNMEEGSMRCDVNVSVRKRGETQYGQRCEIKNINSMRFARKAIAFEAARQVEVLENGGSIEQETRGFDAVSGETFSLREKEYAHDYRYFPDPDLPPINLTAAEIERIRREMPPLPEALENSLVSEFNLPKADAVVLTQDLALARYAIDFLQKTTPALSKPVANLIIHKLKPWCDEQGKSVAENPVSPADWTSFLQLIEDKKVSATMAYQRLFPALLAAPDRSPSALASALNLLQESGEDFLTDLTEGIMTDFPDKVNAYRNGKKGLLGFFMGELMKRSRGKADPQEATRVLSEKLNSK